MSSLNMQQKVLMYTIRRALKSEFGDPEKMYIIFDVESDKIHFKINKHNAAKTVTKEAKDVRSFSGPVLRFARQSGAAKVLCELDFVKKTQSAKWQDKSGVIHDMNL